MFVNEKLQEFERYIKNKRVALIGLGTSNIPLIDYFADKGAQVTVFDKRNMLFKILRLVSIDSNSYSFSRRMIGPVWTQ